MNYVECSVTDEIAHEEGCRCEHGPELIVPLVHLGSCILYIVYTYIIQYTYKLNVDCILMRE